MKESTCLRTIFLGVCLIGVGLLLPSRAPDPVRAVPIVAGSALSVIASWFLVRRPGKAPDERARERDEAEGDES